MPLDPSEFKRLLQQAEDAYACKEILWGAPATEEEIRDARMRQMIKKYTNK